MRGIAQTQSFRDLIDSNYIYIDKTEQIFNLLQDRRVFISRPRRFGKSLMLDTIGTLFEEGVEPYFRNTWIHDRWTDDKYPVLVLNFWGSATLIIKLSALTLMTQFQNSPVSTALSMIHRKDLCVQ